jgi:hypothetical protein
MADDRRQQPTFILLNDRCRGASDAVQCAPPRLTRRIGIGPIVEFGPFVSRTHPSKGEAPMLRKFAVAMIATTMLAAPALAAEKPAVPAGSAATPPASTASKTDAGNPSANPVNSGKTVKTAVHHRKHSYHWYLVHRGRHPGGTLAGKESKPVKHVSVHRPHQETGQQVVKTNKDASGKATQ